MYYRSIMEDFTGIKKEWDRIRGEKKDGEDQIDRTNNSNSEPNTNQGDADYYDPYCGYAHVLTSKLVRGYPDVHNSSR